MVGETLLNYKLLERLGAGGQGEVYRATDTKLGRTVVVKILSPEMTAKQSNLKRFEREAQLASTLDHPNICTIYGLHEVGGTHFIAMQYIEGRNVRQLVNGRPLELKSALSIGVQVADAIAVAHGRGIIHRDIKAGNVMVTDAGLAKVLDFGLAKLLEDEHQASANKTNAERVHLTELGVPYGTATYAAPEQARGDITDTRTDIFSTGVLLYEMLAGTWPFRGTTSVEVRYNVLHEEPKRLSEMRPDSFSPRLQEIVDRAMRKNPNERYQKIDEMRDDLKQALRELDPAGDMVAITTAAELVEPHHQTGWGARWRSFKTFMLGDSSSSSSSDAAATSTQMRSAQTSAQSSLSNSQNQSGNQSQSQSQSGARTMDAAGQVSETHETQMSNAPEAAAQKTIAILPFRNLSNDPAASFYEFSLADAVITELARVRSLIVRSSSLIAKYQNADTDPRAAGRELNVGAVLAASFLRGEDRLRVTAQLLDVASGDILWSDRMDAAAADIIKLQDTIAKRIVDGLRLELGAGEQAELTRRLTESPAAYEEYLRGRDSFGRFVYRTLAPDDCTQAIEHFKRAVELDPDFALAHSGLGACYANLVFKGFSGKENYARAEAAFDEALALDPEVTEARVLMVFIWMARGEKAKARQEIAKLARELPNESSVFFAKGVLHRLDGEYEKALRSFQRLGRLDPAARVVAAYNRARIFMYRGEYEEALKEIDAGARVEADHPLLKTFHAVVLQRSGAVAEGAELLREVLAKHPRLEGVRPLLAACLSKLGRHEEAHAEITDSVLKAAAADHDIAYWLATFYALEGETERAFEWLERAIKLGNENRAWFERDPHWSALRDDARFKQLIEQIKIH